MLLVTIFGYFNNNLKAVCGKTFKCLINHSISTTEQKGNLKKKRLFKHYFNIVCTVRSVEINI